MTSQMLSDLDPNGGPVAGSATGQARSRRDESVTRLFERRARLWREVDRLCSAGRHAAADRAASLAHALELRIAQTPSRTLRDLAMKLAILDDKLGGEGFDDVEVAPAILDDARRIIEDAA